MTVVFQGVRFGRLYCASVAARDLLLLRRYSGPQDGGDQYILQRQPRGLRIEGWVHTLSALSLNSEVL